MDSSPSKEAKNCLNKPTDADKWRFTLYTVIVFLIIANPYTYKLVNSLLGKLIGQIANPVSGCPTTLGFIVHTVVFALILRHLMNYDI